MEPAACQAPVAVSSQKCSCGILKINFGRTRPPADFKDQEQLKLRACCDFSVGEAGLVLVLYSLY